MMAKARSIELDEALFDWNTQNPFELCQIVRRPGNKGPYIKRAVREADAAGAWFMRQFSVAELHDALVQPATDTQPKSMNRGASRKTQKSFKKKFGTQRGSLRWLVHGLMDMFEDKDGPTGGRIDAGMLIRSFHRFAAKQHVQYTESCRKQAAGGGLDTVADNSEAEFAAQLSAKAG